MILNIVNLALFILDALLVNTCCLEAQVDGVRYTLQNTTDSFEGSCPSACVYQQEGSNDTNDLQCFDTLNNDDICDLPPPPPNNERRTDIKPAVVQSKIEARLSPRAWLCGHIYQHAGYGGVTGSLGKSSAVRNFLPWANDYASSLTLQPGCKVTFFDYFNGQGESITYTENDQWIGYIWNDRFSSLTCTCFY